METLETRRLLITGPIPAAIPAQNFANPEDANYDGTVSPADALIVINQLNRGETSDPPTKYSTDIDGDGVMSPRDALIVINRLNSRSDTSNVPPEQRAVGLRQSLEAGVLPPNMTLADAQEMLSTLENGGHYEAGERYRGGQMVNINDPPQDFAGMGAGADNSAAAWQPVSATGGNLLPEAASIDSIDSADRGESDPLALLDSADETLSDSLDDPTLSEASLDVTSTSGSEVIDRLSAQLAEQLADRLASADVRERLAQAMADAVARGDESAEDILHDVEAVRATLGNANSQIAQIFADLDFQAMVQQLGVDLGTLAYAILGANTPVGSVQPDAILAEFISRDYLFSVGESLP
jgi:hypothetical protein